MPISVKDSTGVEGFDACVGYSAWVDKPVEKDSAIIRLLKDAGAVPFVKVSILPNMRQCGFYSNLGSI